MKTSFFSRLPLVCLLLLFSATGSMAQQAVYSEAPTIAKSGYWSLVTNQSTPDQTLVRFFNDQHELLYEERLVGLGLDLLESRAGHRQLARLLGTTLQQVQRMQNNSLVSKNLVALHRHAHPAYLAR